ncbi:hypothetical protein SAMN05518845_11664 [Variovorax sp. YR750]|nr:hypothetical protein SAMN05518845_11664 [Variovorax sp. YR750]
MFDLLESKSWEELKNVGIVTPSSEDILDALKVRIEHNARFHTAMKKHRHIRPDFYGNYAEMLGRYIVAKNGSKSHTHP